MNNLDSIKNYIEKNYPNVKIYKKNDILYVGDDIEELSEIIDERSMSKYINEIF